MNPLPRRLKKEPLIEVVWQVQFEGEQGIDPNPRFAPKMLMEEPGGSFIWQVGDRVITLNCRTPYVG